MKITTEILYREIRLQEPMVNDVFVIAKDEDDHLFYITSENGYDGYEVGGYKKLENALIEARALIENYFIDRNEKNPSCW